MLTARGQGRLQPSVDEAEAPRPAPTASTSAEERPGDFNEAMRLTAETAARRHVVRYRAC